LKVRNALDFLINKNPQANARGFNVVPPGLGKLNSHKSVYTNVNYQDGYRIM